MSAWIIGAAVSGFGVLGLVLASGALDTGMYHFGLALFGFSVLYVFWLIKSHFDEAARRLPHGRE
jgi:hypothetical protein